MTVELGLTADNRWTASVADIAAAAGQAGFAGVGINAARIEHDTTSVLAAQGLVCLELLALVITEDEHATLASAERLASVARDVGARWVLAVLRTGVSERTRALVRRCGQIVAPSGARLAVEFSPFGAITSIREALDAVAMSDPGQVGILIDSWHFSFGPSTWDDLRTVPLDLVAYVQFADGLALRSGDYLDQTLNRRAMPGDGCLELDRFAGTLLGRGWEGLVTVEVLNTDLNQLPITRFAQLAYDGTRRYWP